MFGLGRKPDARLDPRKLAQLTDDQLNLLFAEDKWARLDKPSRLALLQEFENRRAKLDGRPAIRILEGDRQEFERPGSMGYYNDEQRVIRINYRFLEGNSPHHSAWTALDTVIHEGRHAMQYDAIREHPDRVSPQALNEWRANCARYFAPPRADDPQYALKITVYAMQSIEVDARRTARRTLLAMFNEYRARGLDTRSVAAQLRRNLEEEHTIIRLIQRFITPELLDTIERDVLTALKQRFPEVDTEGLRLFDHARLILNARPVDGFEESLDLIEALDRYEEEKLDKPDALNRVHDRIRIADGSTRSWR